MSYASQKGWQGQDEVRKFLNEVFKEWGFVWINVVGTERNKKVLAGDVCLDSKSDPNRKCILHNYFIEVKTRQNVQVFDALAKAEEDAKGWGKWGAIGYFVKQAKGHKGERLIAMRPETFGKLIADLQRSS